MQIIGTFNVKCILEYSKFTEINMILQFFSHWNKEFVIHVYRSVKDTYLREYKIVSSCQCLIANH